MTINKLILIPLLFFFISSLSSHAQERKSGTTLVSNTDAVLDADKIFYYGWDFSNMRFSDGTWVDKT